MTNKEKFEEIFGYKIRQHRISFCLMQEDCATCPLHELPARDCIETSRHYWDQEYKEPINDRKGNENP